MFKKYMFKMIELTYDLNIFLKEHMFNLCVYFFFYVIYTLNEK